MPPMETQAAKTTTKKKKLETCTCLQGYHLTGITKTWWDDCNNWSVGMEGYRLFRKDRHGRKGEDVPSMSVIAWSAQGSASERKRS